MIVEGSFRPLIDEIKNTELRDFVINTLDKKLEKV